MIHAKTTYGNGSGGPTYASDRQTENEGAIRGPDFKELCQRTHNLPSRRLYRSVMPSL